MLSCSLAEIKSLVASAVGVSVLASLIGGGDTIRKTLTHEASQIVLSQRSERRDLDQQESRSSMFLRWWLLLLLD